MDKEDMMNPMNWSKNDYKDMGIALAIFTPFSLLMYFAMWIFN